MNSVIVKRAILGLLLLVTLWLVINAPEPEVVAAVKPVKAVSSTKRAVDTKSETELFTKALPARDSSSSDSYDIFAYQAEKKARPVIAPKPVKPITTKPRKPTAPRLPFEYIGMLQQGQQTKVFLMKQQALHIVTEGDKIDGDYQLKSVTNDELRFIYLPLNATQTLSIENQS